MFLKSTDFLDLETTLYKNSHQFVFHSFKEKAEYDICNFLIRQVCHLVLKQFGLHRKAVFFLVLVTRVINSVPRCNASLTDYLPLQTDGQTKEEIIESYFKFGFSYTDILAFLHLYHGIRIGYRQLQRILRQQGLRRSSGQSDIGTVIDAIERELIGSGGDLGYRSMHERIRRKYHLVISRETVRIVLTHLDPEGVCRRGRRRLHRREYYVKGPNYLWHIDGWDKLKQFGLCVHGCIDGYSRRIMWLEVCSTNNNPSVICKYFTKCIEHIKGLPRQIRADRGTENGNVEIMQTVLRSLNENIEVPQTAFLYGKSTANQRIEAWWSKFGMFGMSTWIRHFKSLSAVGIIDTSLEKDIQCIIFCYIHLLQHELQTIVEQWNTHYIRKSRNGNIPYGRPDSMYYMPEMFGGVDGLNILDSRESSLLSDVLARDAVYCDDTYRKLFCVLMDEGGKALPKNLDKAADLLVYLLDRIDYDLEELDV